MYTKRTAIVLVWSIPERAVLLRAPEALRCDARDAGVA